ncbi:MAG: DNA polymerase, partial [Tepidiformaceae bacterium]
IPELKDRSFNIRAFGERTATNSPLQGSAADLIKVAMIRIHARFAGSRLGARMVLQVHDELVFEVPDAELEAAQAIAKSEMEGAAQLRVRLVVTLGVGMHWLDAKG